MRVIADLHMHSRFSRATSSGMNIAALSRAAALKGINLLGTGDFTHPEWISEIEKQLRDEGNGLYSYDNRYFLLSAEISCIYSQSGKMRRVHIVVLAPSFEIAKQINDVLSRRGNLKADGRPILGISAAELTAIIMGVSHECMVVPAHAWTPWFSLFGSMSGFDSVEECFQDQAKHIHALETGLSSDPAMNWRLSALDKYALVSNSDSHSPAKIGREANVFELEAPSYKALTDAIKSKDRRKFLYTIEVPPEFGKYHYTGHRACSVSMPPAEALAHNNVCTVCRRTLTIGVEQRVEQLADRPAGFVPVDAIPYKRLIPLDELIAAVLQTAAGSAKVQRNVDALVAKFGNELDVLLEAGESELKQAVHEKIADAILLSRGGRLRVKPGYDGVYGEIVFNGDGERKAKKQSMLGDW